jgi:hypothetical protein
MIGRTIAIDDTRFIPYWPTNFAGDATKDRFGDGRRKCDIMIPDPDQAKDLIKAGFKVRETRPRADEDPNTFVPEYFVTALLKYRNRAGVPIKYPPKVYLVSGDNEPVPLDEESVDCLDNIRVKNVNVILNPYEYDPANNGLSLYIRTMYVEQDLDDDPYAARYRARRNNFGEDPF